MRPYALILLLVNLRKYQTKPNGIMTRRREVRENLATKGNLTNKGWNIRVVRKTMLFSADLLGLGNRIVDDILFYCSYYKLRNSRT
ncbi:MAG: hypothetical protein LBC74_00965 [Planctomycetaceae bacterium]|nr:hypothetical protein [Planctomycetaceae bacterium]